MATKRQKEGNISLPYTSSRSKMEVSSVSQTKGTGKLITYDQFKSQQAERIAHNAQITRENEKIRAQNKAARRSDLTIAVIVFLVIVVVLGIALIGIPAFESIRNGIEAGLSKLGIIINLG